MAYPFTRLPSLAEFSQALKKKFNCEYKTLPDGGLEDEEGNLYQVKYFEREVDGQTIQCVVVLEDDAILLPSIVCSICSRLKIDVTELGIGFDLG